MPRPVPQHRKIIFYDKDGEIVAIRTCYVNSKKAAMRFAKRTLTREQWLAYEDGGSYKITKANLL